MKETRTTPQTTADREAEWKRLEERTRIALATAIGKAAKEASTLKLTKKQREKSERIVKRVEVMLKKTKR